MLKVLSVLVVFFAIGDCAIRNYCDSDYCGSERHITCDLDDITTFSPNCPRDYRDISLSSDNIQQILQVHNMFRNQIASGDQPGFSPAAKMATMRWNQDLADYASLNVKRCEFKHDCHNTPEIMHSGQNLYLSVTTAEAFPEITVLIESSIASFYREHVNATQADIDSCCIHENIFHFTAMCLDRANQVGCAIAQYTTTQGKFSYVACNYSFQTLIGQPVYESGNPGSKCESGTNLNYSALCSEKEVIDVNKVF